MGENGRREEGKNPRVGNARRRIRIFSYATRKFVIYFSPHVYYTFFIHFSIVRLDVDIHLPSCIIVMNIGI